MIFTDGFSSGCIHDPTGFPYAKAPAPSQTLKAALPNAVVKVQGSVESCWLFTIDYSGKITVKKGNPKMALIQGRGRGRPKRRSVALIQGSEISYDLSCIGMIMTY